NGIPRSSRFSLKGYEWLKNNLESDEGQNQIEQVKMLAKVAEDINCSLPQLALAWCLKNPNVSTVITGASKPEQVKNNMKSIDFVDKLTDNVINKIENILNNKPKPQIDWRNL
ncbi:MAG: aldo/keto reductase, partial [Anaerolineales bacterium]|nr:aldo/keto reductase [Anaerolineales bacterium]